MQNGFGLSILKDRKEPSAFSPNFFMEASSSTITGQLLDQNGSFS